MICRNLTKIGFGLGSFMHLICGYETGLMKLSKTCAGNAEI